jgi:hypothetical protein
MLDAMHSVARPGDIVAIYGVFADDGDSESVYGQIDEELAAQIMDDLEREWAVALNEGEWYRMEE